MFTQNYWFVYNWNSDPTSTSSVGLNEYADLSTEEFGALKHCLKGSEGMERNPERLFAKKNIKLP